MLIPGAEFKSFYDDETEWPSDLYVDEFIFDVYRDKKRLDLIDNTADILDDDQVEIRSGVCLKEWDIVYSEDVIKKFKKWRKKQNEDLLVVSCPKDKTKDLKEYLDRNNIKFK
jgi:predicted CopG family antitoxin